MVEYSFDQSHHGSDWVKVNEEEISIEEGGGNHSLNWMDTLRSLRAKVRSCKADNERFVRSQKRKHEINGRTQLVFFNFKESRKNKR